VLVVRVVLVGVLVVVLARVVNAAPDPEREHAATEDSTDQQRQQKLHHGLGSLRRARESGRGGG
jgi:hypothetical protein